MSLTEQASPARPRPGGPESTESRLIAIANPGRGGRAALACSVALLLLVYLGISSFCDPRGTLGTDTGGKLATLGEMDREQTWNPDIGYWASDIDPDGLAHPLYYTTRFGESYVNVTTLPVLLAAKTLYGIGGARLALLLPMLGAIACALAGRALAARLGSRRPNLAFWCVGVASPVAIYALDLWEHSLGLACMAWGVVGLVDFVDGRRAMVFTVAVSGALFGIAATMRTEALLYGAAFSAVALGLVARRRLRGALLAGCASVVSVAALLGVNEVAERVLLGGALRSTRAAGTAGSAGAQIGIRAEEGLRTTIGLNYADLATDVLVGSLLVACLGAAVWIGRRPTPNHRHLLEAMGAAAVLYLVRLRIGLSFVSGLFAATPIAVAGVAGMAVRRHRWLVTTALVCMPAVWAVQYVGGAGPQWGGRYLLLSGFVLGTVGVRVLEDVTANLRRAFALLALVVTAYGALFVVQRTQESARLADILTSRTEDVVVTRFGHVFREIGAEYTRDRPWLTAVEPEAIVAVRSIIAARSPDTVAVITYPNDRTLELDGYDITEREPFRFFSEALEIRHYQRLITPRFAE